MDLVAQAALLAFATGSLLGVPLGTATIAVARKERLLEGVEPSAPGPGPRYR